MTTTEIRIENCKKNIEKCQKTLERHKKLLQKKLDKCIKGGISNPDTVDRYDRKVVTPDQYWDICDYLDVKGNIANTERKLEEQQEKLKQWLLKKKAEDDRADVPMVPAVEEFLKTWKTQAKEFYIEQVKKYKDWDAWYRQYYKEQIAELCKEFDEYEVRHSLRNPEIEKAKKERNIDWNYKKNYIKSTFSQYTVGLATLDDEELSKTLDRDLELEVKAKRIDLFERCAAYVGVITDATNLSISESGAIEGIVKGENGKAYVEAILAGGYNIQCLHYRILVKPIKEIEQVSEQKVTIDLKGTTLEELKQIAKLLDIDYKEYSDDRITRMRLVMALKARANSEQ